MNARGRGAHCALYEGKLLTMIAAVLLVAGVLAQSAAAGQAVSAQARQALRFWTPARMKAAKALDLHLPGQEPIALSEPASASSAFEPVPDPTLAETRVNGAIFIETPFGLGRCSGTSVNAPNYSVVFTAGHCINSGGPGGRWMDFRWVFVPGYRYGQRPFGVFPAKWIDTTRQWRTTGSENFDVGAAVVGRNQKGQLLAKAVGGTGIAWGLKAKQVFDVHGYPAEEPFDGETQQLCAGTPFLGHDARSFLTPGPLNLAVDCDVTGGASGGGWTISGGKTLNSVTNYGYGDDPNTDFGAYFGKEVGRLFHRAGQVK
jgi:V8-like Glu-specific endopeptidase